jgi:hypothetical protein
MFLCGGRGEGGGFKTALGLRILGCKEEMCLE